MAHDFHFVCVCVEHTLVVGLAIFCEDFVELFRRLIAVCSTSLLCHLDTTIWHKGTLQRLIGLQTYNLFKVFQAFVDVSSTISSCT